MNKIIFTVLAIIFTCFSGCEEDLDIFYTCLEDLEYEDYEINFHKVIGFDDFGSSGAAMVVAIDTAKNAALITALKFDLPLYSKSFIPNCNPIETAMGYKWSQTNSITTEIARKYPYIADFLTNTSGIRNMNEEISSFLVIKEAEDNEDSEDSDESDLKIFIAIEGEVTLTRKDDPADLLEGELCFIEMTETNANATIQDGALYYSIDDIYLKWDTSNQPD